MRADLRNREHLQPGFRAVNPFCTVPALEPDDGTVLCSTAAIWRYLEETHPEPPAAVGIRCWYALVSSRPSSGA